MFEVSEGIRQRSAEVIDHEPRIDLGLKLWIRLLNLIAFVWTAKREFLVVSVRK